DGTNVVTIGDQKVTFPTTVTDAVWAPDGSRIVFVDSNGAIVTARPDASDLLVLAPGKSGASRRHPAWDATNGQVMFDERTGNAAWNLMAVNANGAGDRQDTRVYQMGPVYGEGPEKDNHGAASSAGPGPGREIAFVHGQADVAEVWVADLN